MLGWILRLHRQNFKDKYQTIFDFCWSEIRPQKSHKKLLIKICWTWKVFFILVLPYIVKAYTTLYFYFLLHNLNIKFAMPLKKKAIQTADCRIQFKFIPKTNLLLFLLCANIIDRFHDFLCVAIGFVLHLKMKIQLIWSQMNHANCRDWSCCLKCCKRRKH